MTVLLVLATFVIFLAIEYFLHGKQVPAVVTEAEMPAPVPVPEVVAGFKLPEHLRYHPGHMWAAQEGEKIVRVGMDDFAARLLGKVEQIKLPQRGQWVRQGQKIVAVTRDGASVELVSPIEGVVTDVNDALSLDPTAASQDPYGKGWLITVNAPEANTNFRNLLGGILARKWTEEAALRLRARLLAAPISGGMSTAPAMAQDGGMAVEDIAAQLPHNTWNELAREFFLS
jgi:glycine cleavage system H lipoate-binding protein